MPLATGTQLGPYEILSLIGKGGMGEVYKARDTRLSRIVALKVSQERFGERFEREARAVAALNHPHICQLYDVGPNYLVMEYVEGEPLKGPLPLERAVLYGGQILEALDHAHRNGITHRDLKPANILVAKTGIKLLDFGLAKIRHAPLKETDETLTMAVTKPLTQDGQILGTLQYMSPEQLNGKEADHRSDLFAFGCVLYEVLTGKRAFPGSSAASVIAAILERPAPSITDVAPYALDRVLKKCLEKDPDRRWQNPLDLKSALEWAALPTAESPAASQTGRPTTKHARFNLIGWAAAGVLAIAAIALGIIAFRATRPAPLKPLVRLDVDLGPDVSLAKGTLNYGTNLALAPDGSKIAYISNKQIFLRNADQENAVALPGTIGALNLFFSPDGKQIGFFTTSKLRKVEITGGAVVDLADASNSRGGSWGGGGFIAAALTTGGVIWQVPEAGGKPVALTHFEEGETAHRWPQLLPGGTAVLYTASAGNPRAPESSTVVFTLGNHKRKVLQRGSAYARYVPTYGTNGHILFMNNGALYAVPFDPQTLEMPGEPVKVLDGVAYGQSAADFSFTEGAASIGTFVYRKGGASAENSSTLQWFDSKGQTRTLLGKPDAYRWPSVAPGGDRVAFSTTDVWAYDPRRDTTTRVSFDSGQMSVWTPDGQYLVYRKVGQGLFGTRADGGGKAQLLVETKNQVGPIAFTADGRTLAYQDISREGSGYNLWTVSIEIDASGIKAGKPQAYLQTKFNERGMVFSPDGHWAAYVSDESGSNQVYVRAFPDNGSKWQISSGGGDYPRFSRGTNELFYRAEDSSKIYAVSYTATSGSFVADKPRVWLDKQLLDTGDANVNYDVAPDGKRILGLVPVNAPEDQPSQNHVVFLENFFDELKRKVPQK